MIFIKNGVHITGNGSKNSLALLPIQFTNCLKIKSLNPSNLIIFRANLIQTGIIFNGALDEILEFNLNPLNDSSCLGLDIDDSKRLIIKR